MGLFGKDTLFSIVFGLTFAFIGIMIQLYGKKYISTILIIGASFIILSFFIFFLVAFLKDRENRWNKNKKQHILLSGRVNILENELKNSLSFLNTNDKINKLELQINRLNSQNETKKSPN
jgi:hypothetical protein|tara:strand:- start:350 stop:709 length:360 start_codon:yes stop_codon:yes gene_type:complete